jgi:hypothetical protein
MIATASPAAVTIRRIGLSMDLVDTGPPPDRGE